MFAAVVHSSVASQPPLDVSAIERSLDPFGASGDTGSWSGPGAVIVRATLTENGEVVAGRRVIASWARIDNRSSIAVELGCSPELGDDELILAAFDRWGDQCTEHLVGDFSFVVFDPATLQLFAGRDPLGVRPLYYVLDPTPDGPRLIVSTTAAVFPTVGDVQLTPSERWMANFVSRSSTSHIETAWEEVRKLPGGHTLAWTPGDDRPRVTRYHKWRNDAPKTKRRAQQSVDDYRDVLHEAVRCRLGGSAPIGIETSGGIDSSTCLALAAKLGERSIGDIHAFGYVTAEKERDYILQTSEMYGITNNHIFGEGFEERTSNPDIVDRTLTVLGYPHEHGNGPGHDQFYARCEKLGIHGLQSGFGGDEAVTNPGGPLVRELIDQRRFVHLYADLAGPWYEKIARFAKTVWTQRRGMKRPGGLRTALEPMVALYGLRPEVDERTGTSETQMKRISYDEGFRDLNEWILTERLGNSFVPTRLENCSLMARSRGIDYTWPLLDQRLIQQYLSTPSIEKRGPGTGRYLHRRAIDGDVPDDVAWKVSKEMGESLSGGQKPLSPDRVAKVLADLHPIVAALVDVDKIRSVAAMTTPDAERVTRTQINQISLLNHWLHKHHPVDDA